MDTAVVVGAHHLEPRRQEHRERPEVVLRRVARRRPRKGLDVAEAGRPETVTRGAEQRGGDALPAMLGRYDETEDGADFVGVRDRLVVESMRQHPRYGVAPAHGLAVEVGEMAPHATVGGSFLRQRAILGGGPVLPRHHRMVLVEALAVAGRPARIVGEGLAIEEPE